MTIAAVLGSKGGEVATIAVDSRMQDAAQELARRRIGALVVTDGGEPVGMLSERDLVQCAASHGAQVLELPVSQAMTSPLITAEPEMPVLAALALMTNRRVRHLPVVKGGQLTGIVSIGDLVKYRMERIEAEAEAMRAYIQSA